MCNVKAFRRKFYHKFSEIANIMGIFMDTFEGIKSIENLNEGAISKIQLLKFSRKQILFLN